MQDKGYSLFSKMLLNDSKATRNLRVSCLIFAIWCTYPSTQAANFDGCDFTFNMTAGDFIQSSPDYPNNSPRNTSCRYKIVAPLDHEIIVNCALTIDKGPNGCTTDHFYLARDGDLQLRDAEQFCGEDTFKRISVFRSVVLAYNATESEGRFICYLSARPQQCDCGWSINTKVVNGEEASINEYPSMAVLRDIKTGGNLFCAAVIISHRYLLTAAHCMNFQSNRTDIEVHVGRHNINSSEDTKYSAVYNVKKIINHPMYTGDPFNNDIALVKTKTAIEFSRGVGPICLPPPEYANNDFLNEAVDVIGWGATMDGGILSPTLQKVTLNITDNQMCSERYKNIYPTHICTHDADTGKDSCQRDSGGPLIFKKNRQFLVGIISNGISCGVSKPTIAVNTRVTSYLKWIDENTKNSICNVKM